MFTEHRVAREEVRQFCSNDEDEIIDLYILHL